MFKVLNDIWRFCLTGIGFAAFGIGALILSVVLFPIFNLFVRDRLQRKKFAHKAIAKTFYGYVWILRFLRIFDFRFENFDELNRDENTIVVANHPSLLDIVFLGAAIEHCNCIVKDKLLKNFFVKGVIGAADYIPNDDIEQFIQLCSERLTSKDKLVIFPEGTRTTRGKPMKLQRGAANIALRIQKDIRLVSISLDYPMLTKEHKWYRIPPKKPTFIIRMEEKIIINDYLNNGHSLSINARLLTEDLQNRLSTNLTKYIEDKNDTTQ